MGLSRAQIAYLYATGVFKAGGAGKGKGSKVSGARKASSGPNRVQKENTYGGGPMRTKDRFSVNTSKGYNPDTKRMVEGTGISGRGILSPSAAFRKEVLKNEKNLSSDVKSAFAARDPKGKPGYALAAARHAYDKLPQKQQTGFEGYAAAKVGKATSSGSSAPKRVPVDGRVERHGKLQTGAGQFTVNTSKGYKASTERLREGVGISGRGDYKPTAAFRKEVAKIETKVPATVRKGLAAFDPPSKPHQTLAMARHEYDKLPASRQKGFESYAGTYLSMMKKRYK